MARKKVYIVKSGSLHPTTREYWLTPSYHTSKKGALESARQTLECNRAKELVEWHKMVENDDHMLRHTDYIGEEGKYKGRLIVEWAYLNDY